MFFFNKLTKNTVSDFDQILKVITKVSDPKSQRDTKRGKSQSQYQFLRLSSISLSLNVKKLVLHIPATEFKTGQKRSTEVKTGQERPRKVITGQDVSVQVSIGWDI